MATLFGDLPSAGVRSGRSSALVTANGSVSSATSERALQWVYDEETSNCMHCNTPFTLITRKVRACVMFHEGMLFSLEADAHMWSVIVCVCGYLVYSITVVAVGT